MTRSPFEFFTKASRTFHSSGTVQSNAAEPLGTSCTVIGVTRCSRRSVSRTPSPVMLRQIGIQIGDALVELTTDRLGIDTRAERRSHARAASTRPTFG